MFTIALQFIKIFFTTVFYVSPILVFLVFSISILGLIVGKIEKWHPMDSLYFAFITATTVGYGDFHPESKVSKCLSIFVALTGLVLTGILVAIGVFSVEKVFQTINK